jgi:WD40 repeat protein
VSLWDAAKAAEIVQYSNTADVMQMAFSPGGDLFASGDERGGILVWQTAGECIARLQHDEPISHLVFSPDGTRLAVASLDAAVRVWIVAPDALARAVQGRVSGPLTPEEWTRYLGDEPRPDGD